MIKKIVELANIGRFENYSAIGDVELRKLTLIYAENGKGKTTLTAIMRSLKNGDAVLVTERLTLGSNNPQYAKILLDEGEASFKDGAWDRSNPEMEIFDSTFVNENIFSGEVVEHDHKKNLYRFVVGEQGVLLAKKVDELDSKIRNVNVNTANKELELKSKIQSKTLTIPQFLALQNNLEAPSLINQKEAELESVKKSSEITQKPQLQTVSLPTVPTEEVKQLLEKTIADLSSEAETKTKSHIQSCMDKHGESWVQQGLAYIKDSKCPMCGQNFDDMSLIEAYRGYFNEGYNNLKDEIALALEGINSLFSEAALVHVQRAFAANEGVLEFWKNYIPFDYPVSSFDDIQISWNELRSQLQATLDLKESKPLESASFSSEINSAVKSYETCVDNLAEYNKQIVEFNLLVAEKKLAAGGGNATIIVQEILRFKDSVTRHTSEVSKICGEYQMYVQEKRRLEEEKKQAKNDLEQFTKEVFKKYQDRINQYLSKFGAGFEIVETGTSFGGGRPSSTYKIKIENTSVNLGDQQTVGEACFRNVLSQGDKNSLAFAFFLARLQEDTLLSNKTIIFDDPINSLDNHRQDCTKQEIADIADKAQQTIVMSHDPQFLRRVRDYVHNLQMNSLKLVRQPKGSGIVEWKIAEETESPYVRDYKQILNFIAAQEQASADVARCIRPVLEGYYRMKFPIEFPSDKWLGELIESIRNAKSGETLIAVVDKLSELEAVNDYSKQFHHNTNPTGWNSVQINDGELLAFAKRALVIVKQ